MIKGGESELGARNEQPITARVGALDHVVGKTVEAVTLNSVGRLLVKFSDGTELNVFKVGTRMIEVCVPDF